MHDTKQGNLKQINKCKKRNKNEKKKRRQSKNEET